MEVSKKVNGCPIASSNVATGPGGYTHSCWVVAAPLRQLASLVRPDIWLETVQFRYSCYTAVPVSKSFPFKQKKLLIAGSDLTSFQTVPMLQTSKLM